jgi:hypothetical protein
MDPDDSADMYAILGLAGVGVALMLVGSLDLMGVAVVLAVFVPSLAAGLSAVVMAVISWRRTRHGAEPHKADARRGYREACREHRNHGAPHRAGVR